MWRVSSYRNFSEKAPHDLEPISPFIWHVLRACVCILSAPTQPQCVKGGCPDGSAWAKHAQEVIGTNVTAGWSLSVVNNYVDLGANPLTGGEFHLPVITPNAGKRSIGVTTYTQATWDLLDDAGAAVGRRCNCIF